MAMLLLCADYMLVQGCSLYACMLVVCCSLDAQLVCEGGIHASIYLLSGCTLSVGRGCIHAALSALWINA